MKKFRFNRKKLVKTLAIVGCAVGAYLLAHKAGTAERGYDAVGGEIFIPFLILFAEDIWGMIKEPFEVVK